jgi:small subunit ribosomal protein S1
MEENFKTLLEEYFQRIDAPIKVGDVIKGVVVHFDGENYFVDLGGKAEAILPKTEVVEPEEIKLGEELSAIVTQRGKSGVYVLSVKKLFEKKVREEFEELFAKGLPLRVKVISSVKGGYVVSFKGVVSAFLPGSQAEKDPDLVGKEITVIPLEKENSYVVSQKAYLAKERELKKKELEEKVREGIPLVGRVKAKVKGGFIVDFEGVIAGFLPFSELTHRRLTSPEDYLQIGDEVCVSILSYDPIQGKLKVSLKALEKDPWAEVLEKYPVDSRHVGTVVEVKPFGAFVELDPGIEGLIPASEVSWQRGLKPQDVLSQGDRVEVVVLEVKPEERRMLLSLKRLEEDPWEVFAREHKVGDIVHGKVRGVVDFGLFVEVREGVVGFVHRSEVSWKRNLGLKEAFSEGSEVTAKILELNPLEKRLKLSIKALVPNPWDVASETLKPGTNVSGKVKQILPGKGYLVEITEDILGFLPFREVPQGEKFKEGDKIQAKVILFDREKERVHLSVIALKEEEERMLAQEYLSSQSPSGSHTLGKVLKCLAEREGS